VDTGRRKTSTTCQQARVHAQTEAAAARSSALAAEPRHPRSADAAKRQWTSCGSRSDRGARIWSRALHATISSGRTARAGTGNMAAALNNMPDEPRCGCRAARCCGNAWSDAPNPVCRMRSRRGRGDASGREVMRSIKIAMRRDLRSTVGRAAAAERKPPRRASAT